MRALDSGHAYELNMLDGEGAESLVFVKREGEQYPGNIGHHAGTTSQEVLRALIERAIYVNRQIPCWQTRLSIFLMGAVVWLYEYRAARRHNRKAPGMREAIYGETCQECGHVGCGRRAETQGKRENPKDSETKEK